MNTSFKVAPEIKSALFIHASNFGSQIDNNKDGFDLDNEYFENEIGKRINL